MSIQAGSFIGSNLKIKEKATVVPGSFSNTIQLTAVSSGFEIIFLDTVTETTITLTRKGDRNLFYELQKSKIKVR